MYRQCKATRSRVLGEKPALKRVRVYLAARLFEENATWWRPQRNIWRYLGINLKFRRFSCWSKSLFSKNAIETAHEYLPRATMRRVVITVVGPITSIGIGKEKFWAAI